MGNNSEEDIDSNIFKKYDIGERVGKGAYGVVWKAKDRASKEVVAVKKIFDAFQNSTDAQRTFREIMLLQELQDHKGIIGLLNVIKAENDNDIYLIFESMETDLHAVIRAGILQEVHKQYIMYQLLSAIKYIHSANVLHRDLKPSNILLNSDCSLKVADFGLARCISSLKANPESPEVLTEYVATRWYRAPEILLASTSYTNGVDMWAVGCILGELLACKPLLPGKSTLNQLEKIIEITGAPGTVDVESMQSSFAPTILDSIKTPKRPKNLRNKFQDANAHAIDLLYKLLRFNPKERLSADEALKHPYVQQFFTGKERIYAGEIKLIIDDNSRRSIKEYRTTLYNDIKKKRKKRRKESKRRKKESRKKKKKKTSGSTASKGKSPASSSASHAKKKQQT